MTRKIKVLQAANELGLGGIEKVLQNYTEHLAPEIFEVSVCGLVGGGEREKILRGKGFEVFILNGNQAGLMELMRSKKIDILHIHQHGDMNRLAVNAARGAQVPVVVETNVFGRIGASGPHNSPDMNLLVSKMCALRYKLWQKLSWEEFFKNSNVLYNPVVLSDFVAFDEPAKLNLRRKYRIPDNFYVIGRHGRPDPSKWGDLGLKMMPHLLRLIPHVKFLALGAPAEKIKQIRKMGLESAFIFLDPTPDSRKINEFLGLLDVFAYASENGETFGLALAEAMAGKIPVVVNSTPCRDNAQVELIDHGRNGIIANHPRDFAAAIAFLLKNGEKRREMGEAGREKIEDHYDIERNTRRLEKIYLELLHARGVAVDPGMWERCDRIETRPSRDEMVNFESEYHQRIRNCYGRKNYWQIYFWEYCLRDFDKYRKIKLLKDIIQKKIAG